MKTNNKLLLISCIFSILSIVCYIGYFVTYKIFNIFETANYLNLVTLNLFKLPLIIFCFTSRENYKNKYFYNFTFLLLTLNIIVNLLASSEYLTIANSLNSIVQIVLFICIIILSFKTSKKLVITTLILNFICFVFNLIALLVFPSNSITILIFESIGYYLSCFSGLFFLIAIFLLLWNLYGNLLIQNIQSKNKENVNSNDIETLLVKLKLDYENKIITEEEYKEKRQYIIDKL